MADLEYETVVEEHGEMCAGSVEGNLSDSHPEANEQHEASAPDAAGNPPGETLANGMSQYPLGIETTMETEDAPPAVGGSEEETPAYAKDAPTSPTKAKAKASISVKPVGSSSSAPSTPTVKKVLKSGTFGLGTAKPPPAAPSSKPTATSSAAATKPAIASSLRKSISIAGTAPSKATMPPPSRQPTTPALPASSRRASIVPKAPTSTAATSRPPALSSSTNTKPPATSVRASVASPDSASSLKSSASARPRASVSEGVKRAGPAPRASIVPSPAPNRPSSNASVRSGTRTAGSISSIKEVRDDSKALDDLQNKLAAASTSLATKNELIEDLEVQLGTLRLSLDAALADVQAKSTAVEESEKAKEQVEFQLAKLKQTVVSLSSEQDGGQDLLRSVQDELQTARAAADSQGELVRSLQAKIESLEAEIVAAKDNLDVLRSSTNDTTSAAAAEHEALLKAQDTLSTTQAELEQVRSESMQLLQERQDRIKALESQAAQANALETQVSDLTKENEDKANKISELEIEVLEMKEEQEASEDARNKSLARVKSLEDELARVSTALAEANETASAKEEEFAHAKEIASQAHSAELQRASEEYATLADKLETLETELASAIAAKEQANSEAAVAAEAHRSQVADVEAFHVAKQTELAEQIKAISTELENQESKYNAKVDAVKAEHEVLLKEAFERAKSEAGAIHSQDLQSLRGESRSTMEQLRSAHQTTIDTLKIEHEEAIRSQVAALEKQLAGQQLELKATRDDLAKSKAAVTSVSTELESTKSQLEEARQLVAALDRSDKDETIAQLTRDLSNIREEHTVVSEMLSATNDSLREITNNHTTELEEAAKGRAEEVTKLRAAHDEEVAALTNDRIGLITRISDLEGELATAKAALITDPLTSPRSNGAAHARSSSVSKEELSRLHEAHNLKMNDLQAEHERAIRIMREDLEVALGKADHLNQELNRKTMEIQYLEQDQEESQDQITRLKEDVEHLAEQLHPKEHGSR